MQKALGLSLLLPALVLVGCSKPPTTSTSTAMADSGKTYQQAYDAISADDLKNYTKAISSDDMEGRLPASPGEKKTLDYLTAQFKQLGLKPGNGDSYLQPVKLVGITADPNMTLKIGQQTLHYKDTMMLATSREQEHVEVNDSDVVFVGYGINAPEYNWNDYANVDVKGKTVIILVNDPGFENPQGGKFQGKTMTYYGRWTYKYEEASRQGAAAAIIVHETAPASYGWSVVANSWSGTQYTMVKDNKNMDRVALEGWVTHEAAQNIFRDAGMDYEAEKAKAMQGPIAEDMHITASATVNSTFKHTQSYNVIATLPGSKHPDEHVIYTAHWDHLGKDPSLQGDQIYNGAHDNATGVAGVLTLAKAFASLKTAPSRSNTFLVVTAEEQGLLGSQYYAEHPIIPLDKTVADINMDAINLLGKTKDVAVVGKGKSELEEYLADAAKRQGRHLVNEDHPEAGGYFRSDHFSFAKVGVPSMNAEAGSEPIDAATAAYREKMEPELRKCYHQVCDNFNPDWDFSGMQEDIQMLFDVGYHVANTDKWPQWYKTSEFQRQK